MYLLANSTVDPSPSNLECLPGAEPVKYAQNIMDAFCYGLGDEGSSLHQRQRSRSLRELLPQNKVEKILCKWSSFLQFLIIVIFCSICYRTVWKRRNKKRIQDHNRIMQPEVLWCRQETLRWQRESSGRVWLVMVVCMTDFIRYTIVHLTFLVNSFDSCNLYLIILWS